MGFLWVLLKKQADTSSEFSKYEVAEPLHDLNENVKWQYYIDS
jgi:hypothetical protein